MAFVKRGDAQILTVIEDKEHDLDDKGTRKMLEKASDDQASEIEKKKASKIINPET